MNASFPCRAMPQAELPQNFALFAGMPPLEGPKEKADVPLEQDVRQLTEQLKIHERRIQTMENQIARFCSTLLMNEEEKRAEIDDIAFRVYEDTPLPQEQEGARDVDQRAEALLRKYSRRVAR